MSVPSVPCCEQHLCLLCIDESKCSCDKVRNLCTNILYLKNTLKFFVCLFYAGSAVKNVKPLFCVCVSMF